MNRYVPWGTLLHLLGTEVRSAALPARGTCPVCGHAVLQVYRDHVLGGQWYWCPKCRVAGDGIELAARTWRIGAVAAVFKLMSAGVPFPPETDEAAIRRYVDDHIEARARVDALWREAAATVLPLDGALAAFARRLGVPQVRPSDWAARGGLFVGFTHRRKVVDCFQPYQFAEPGRGERGEFRIFKGKGWDQLVVIPYRDLPGRLRGLLLIGREGKYPEDFIYRRVTDVPAAVTDHGLAMLEALVGPHHPAFGATAFACTDPVEAVRLQLAHLAEHGRPLPLVGTWGEAPSPAWGSLPRRPIVVFGPDTLPSDAARLVRHAHAAGTAGRVTVAAPARPTEVLKSVLASQESWQARLEGKLAASDPATAEELFLGVGLERGDAARFLRECGPEARGRLSGLADVDRVVRSVEFGRCVVCEQDGRWIDVRTGDLISDVIVRVDRVVHYRRRKLVTLEGTLRRGGGEAPFSAAQHEVERRVAASWLRRTCAASGLGMPSVASHWGARLFPLAQLFHTPSFLETDGLLGWDEEHNCFAFPRFLLTASGDVLPGAGAPSDEAPGLDFDPPTGLLPDQVAALSCADEPTRLLWATAAVVAAGAVASCLGLAPGAVAFAGRGAIHSLLPAATAMGCPFVAASGGGGAKAGMANTRVHTLRQSCVWPIVVAYADRTADKLVADLPPGVLCRVSDWTADVLSLLGGWTIVDPPAAVSTRAAATYGPAVLPNYLRHFCTHKLHIGTGTLVAAVLDDMAAWFEGCGGDAHAVRRAAALIRPDDESAFPDRFADLVSRIFYEGDLTTTRCDLGEAPSRHPSLAVLEGGLLHIPRAGVMRALARRETPHLDVALTTGRLAAAGILIDDREHGGLPGWVVPEEWWGERLRRWRARNQHEYRKVD